MKKTAVLALSTLAIACSAVAANRANDWEIGPNIRGKNYSVGMPATLSEGQAGPTFNFPYPNEAAGHVHYVTRPTGSMLGATQMRIRYRIEAAPGVEFVARERRDRDATLSLFFQRRGDTWTARGRYETYRWYVLGAKMMPLEPGTHEITVDLEDDWKAVQATTSGQNPQAFQDALANAESVGFVFGSGGGRGHGVYATGPARFTLLDFEIR